MTNQTTWVSQHALERYLEHVQSVSSAVAHWTIVSQWSQGHTAKIAELKRFGAAWEPDTQYRVGCTSERREFLMVMKAGIIVTVLKVK